MGLLFDVYLILRITSQRVRKDRYSYCSKTMRVGQTPTNIEQAVNIQLINNLIKRRNMESFTRLTRSGSLQSTGVFFKFLVTAHPGHMEVRVYLLNLKLN